MDTFQSQILSKPFLWHSPSHIFGVEIEIFPKSGDIELQPEVGIVGYFKATPYVYRSVYANLGYIDLVRNKRFFLPKEELTSIGNVLRPPDDLEINALNCWLRDGQSVRFTAYLETEEMRSLRMLSTPAKEWRQVTDLYSWDANAKTAISEILVDGSIGKVRLLVPNGLTGSGNLSLSCLSSTGTSLTSATNAIALNSVKNEITLPVGESWNGRITFTLSVTTGNFPESFTLEVQNK